MGLIKNMNLTVLVGQTNKTADSGFLNLDCMSENWERPPIAKALGISVSRYGSRPVNFLLYASLTAG